MSGGSDGPDGARSGGESGGAAGAVVLGLLAGPEADRSVDEALEAADRAARDHRVLLVNLADPGEALDRRLGGLEGRGLRDLDGGMTLRDVARRPADHDFLFLAAGREPSDSGGTPLAGDPRILGLLARVAERVREADGRLLLYLGPRDSWPPGPGQLVDAVMPLAGAEVPDGIPGEVAVIGEDAGTRPRPGDEAAPSPPPETTAESGAAASEPGEESSRATGGGEGWRRHRRTSGPPWGRIGLGAVLVLALAAGWWWLAREGGAPGAGAGEAPPDGPGPAAAETARAPASDASPESATEEPGSGSVGGREAALASAPELPYSVLIASYAEWSQARERLERWSAEDAGTVYFAAPTRVRGRLYWRLFAGALPDRETATGLMERLVEEGRKDRARSWDVRPVARAFREGVYVSRDSASARAGELREMRLPAYVLAAVADDTVWQVYLGAYRSADAAAPLERRLREAETEAELVTRRGESEIR